eukprot:2686257-Prorocentrum_lima.AAC.1
MSLLDKNDDAFLMQTFNGRVVEEKGWTVWRSVCVWRRVGGAEGRASFEWLKRPYKSAEAVEEGGTLLHDEL